MTVQQIYTTALSLMPSSPSEDNSLEQFAVVWTNLCLREMLDVENSIRASKGETLLTDAPTLTALSDVVPYSQRLTEEAAVYFMASIISKDDDDPTHEQYYRANYVNSLSEAKKAVGHAIEDIYRGEANA